MFSRLRRRDLLLAGPRHPALESDEMAGWSVGSACFGQILMENCRRAIGLRIKETKEAPAEGRFR